MAWRPVLFLGITGLVMLGLCGPSLAADRAQLPIRFHVNALQESPIQKYSAAYANGQVWNIPADNAFANLGRVDGLGQFQAVPGQTTFAIRLMPAGGAVQSAIMLWTVTDRPCAVAFNTQAAQNAGGGVFGREYEVSSIVTYSGESIPRKSVPYAFCAPNDGRFDVTFNAAGPTALPVVISLLSASNDSNIIHRLVWFLVL